MIKNELKNLLEYIEREKGINKNELIEVIENSMTIAGKKIFGNDVKLKVEFNKETLEIVTYVEFKITNNKTEKIKNLLNIDEAIKINPKIKIDDKIMYPISHKEFGRIAVKLAKQAILLKLKQIERERGYTEYKDHIGNIISGVVKEIRYGDIIVDFQFTEGILFRKNKIPGNNYTHGDRINALLIDIDREKEGTSPSLILSQSDNDFIKKLFEREITEVADNIVIIKDIAREPGIRTKISVYSKDDKIDPIGACVGVKGKRIKNITIELGLERLDIVRYNSDIIQYTANSLQPAIIQKVELVDNSNNINVYVIEDQIKLAIGKNGQNIRLCEQLLNSKIIIFPINENENEKEQKIDKPNK